MNLNAPQKQQSQLLDATIYAAGRHIMEQKGEMTVMKLHKLLYYCQAWSLVWDGVPLFEQRIEAWASGPVIPDLYKLHKGQFVVSADTSWLNQVVGVELTGDQTETIDAILEAYGDKDSAELSWLTHHEEPWSGTREGVPLGERSNREISHESMANYYSSLIE